MAKIAKWLMEAWVGIEVIIPLRGSLNKSLLEGILRRGCARRIRMG